MTGIILLSDNEKTITEVERKLPEKYAKLINIADEAAAEDIIEKNPADIFIFDCNSEKINIIEQARKLKLTLQSKDIRSIALLPQDNIDYDILKYVSSYITRPIDENLFIATINTNIQLSETLRVMSKNNYDLHKSLYQLNVLYNTGMQLAGTLDKMKLTDIMTEGLDRGLSLSLSYALIFNDANDIRLVIKSRFPLSQRLENAIKLRALLSYKNLFAINPSPEEIKVEKQSKDKFGEYDLNVFNFDNLFSPININDKFFGIIEVFREGEFTNDDTKCFNTLVKQVSLPLESAVLYDEIKENNEKLKKLEELKSQFISIVSHELKTPLTSLNTSIDVILKGMTGEIGEATENFLNLAKRNVTRLYAIIKDLLDIQKIEADKMDFKFEINDIIPSIENVKNTLEGWAKEQNVTIKTELAKELPAVFIDTQRIEQILNNLISNAVKFSKENGTVTIRTALISSETIRKSEFFDELPEEMNEKYVQITVKDDGIGIAKENWNKIFEQFEQIENSLSRKVGGSGLGIPIAKKLTDAHKGYLWLNSALNKGTSFYLAIPVLNEEEIFWMSLEREIKRTAYDHINTAVIGLCENALEDKSFTDKILSEDIIRKTSVHKEISFIKDGKRYFYCYSSDIESYVFDLDMLKFQTYVKNNSEAYKESDLKYSAVLSPRDGAEVKEIIEKINDFGTSE